MPVGFDEDSFLEYNPLKDAKDKVVELIDKIARELEASGSSTLRPLISFLRRHGRARQLERHRWLN